MLWSLDKIRSYYYLDRAYKLNDTNCDQSPKHRDQQHSICHATRRAHPLTERQTRNDWSLQEHSLLHLNHIYVRLALHCREVPKML